MLVLLERYDTESLEEILVPREAYRPFPTIEEREQWDTLPLSLKRFWVKQGMKRLNHSWPTITATQYMDYSRTGNRNRYDTISWQRRQDLASLVVAECIEHHGRFLDDIINGIWCICEETFWGIPGNGYMMKRHDPLPDVSDQIIELFSAETAALLAWTYYLLKSKLDLISIMVCERISLEVKRRVLDPYLRRTDFWWMGFNQEPMLNNWNPWCNSNCLAAFLLLENDPQRRVQAVAKVMRSLDSYIHRLPTDGGCEEGPKYWTYAGGKLLDCLELLHSASEAKIDVYQNALIKQIGRYIYKAFIADSYYVNFADSPAKINIPAELTYRFGRRIGDARLCGLGTAVLKRSGENSTTQEFGDMFRLLHALFSYREMENDNGESPYIRDAWLAETQMMVAREHEGTPKGLYLAAKGGHNAESHNHNDIGSFIVYCDGTPMVVDPGVLTYTAKSFFAERYNIWAMQSAYHNVPMVNGVQQKDGRQYRPGEIDYHQEEKFTTLSMNIAGAYPESAEIKGWIRTFSLIRGPRPRVEITDKFQLQRAINEITLILMSPHLPQVETPGKIVLQGENRRKVIIRYDGDMFEASPEPIPLDDEAMRDIWGDKLFRLNLRAVAAMDSGKHTIEISMG